MRVQHFHAMLCIGILYFIFTAAVRGQLLACVPSDYTDVLGPCNSTTALRRRTYAKVPGAECSGPSTLDLQEQVPCACSLRELLPQVDGVCTSLQQQQGVFLSGYTAGPNCTLAPSLQLDHIFPVGTVRCACTAADIGVTLTDCVNGLRRRVAFWKRDCRETPSLTLPATAWFSCATQCGRGQRMGPRGVCEPCPAGTFGITAKQWLAPYQSLPVDAFTTCVAYNGGNNSCTSSWGPSPSDNGASLTSGPAVDGVATDNEIMFLVDVSRFPATLSFEYTVSSEPFYDYLVVYVNGDMALLQSGEVPWTKFSLSLKPPAASDALCAWRIESACLQPNQFAPYLVHSFFDATAYAYATPVRFRLVQASCDGFQRFDEDVATKVIFLMSISQGVLARCGYSGLIDNALKVGTGLGVVFITDDVLTGSNTWASFGNFGIGSVSVADGAALLARFQNGVTASLRLHYAGATSIKYRIAVIYSKDPSVSAGADMAKIRNVVVDGAAGDMQCSPCPVGTASTAGSTACTPCPANTGAPWEGQAWPCMACPEGTGSPAGGNTCVVLPPCGIADFLPLRSPCVVRNGTFVQNFTTVPVYPSRCNLNMSGYVPQPVTEVPCDYCPAGMFRSTVTGHCEQCAENQIAVVDPRTDTHTCGSCPAGNYPSKSLSFPNFNRLHNVVPSYIVLDCTLCLGAGWAITDSSRKGGVPGASDAQSEPAVLGADVFSVGPGVLPGAVASMTWNITTMVNTAIDFSWTLLAKPSAGKSRVVFTIFALRDGRNVTVWETVVFDSATSLAVPFATQRTGTSAMPSVEPGIKFFQWRYYNDADAGTSTTANAVFAVTTVMIPSADNGAASACTMCLPGYECPVGVAKPRACSPATFTEAYATLECRRCPLNTVSSRTGSSSCATCLKGTVPDSWGRFCDMPGCSLTTGVDVPTTTVLTTVRRARTPLGIDPIQRMDLTGFGVPTTVAVTGLEQRLQTVSVDFSLCGATQQCVPGGLQAYACGKTSNGDAFFLGDFLSPYPLRQGNTTVGVTFHITGAMCHADPSRQHLTIINLVCDASVARYQVDSARAPTPCMYNITLRTARACPRCTNASFVKSVTSCSEQDGTAKSARDIYYNYAYADGTIVDTPICVGGEPLPRRETEECPWISWQLSNHWDASWNIALVVVLVLVLIVGCALYFWLSHRKLYAQYTKLQGGIRSDNVEMHVVAGDGDVNGGEQGGAETRREAAEQPPRHHPNPTLADERPTVENDSEDFDDDDANGLRRQNAAHPATVAVTVPENVRSAE